MRCIGRIRRLQPRLHINNQWVVRRVLPVLAFGSLLLGPLSMYAQQQPGDSADVDLPYPVKDPFDPSAGPSSPFDLQDPGNVQTKIVYDPETDRYVMYKKIGDHFVRFPRTFTREEYLQYQLDNSMSQFWHEKYASESAASGKRESGKKPLLTVENESFDRIFGGNTIDIRPQGSAELIMGVNVSRTDNPALAERQRKISTFDFDQKIQFNLVGSIGDKLKIGTNFNTEATFDFENELKLNYEGEEDDIIKKLEAGNVTFPLNNSLITGSQSLFGLKTQLQFGRLTVTTVFSQQRGQKSEIETTGGAQLSEFEFKADDYEANKHYFLSQFFRDQYDQAMASLPNVNSGINITRIEVYITNTNNTVDQTRNFVAFSDLGEDPVYTTPGVTLTDREPNTRLPDNDHNNIYPDFSQDPNIVGFTNAATTLEQLGYRAAVHFEKIESARRLPESAYTLNRRLGFISLNSQPLNNDEVLAVAFEYTFQGKTYQVGQFSTDGIEPPNALILKMLKSTVTNPKIPIWDLMMKNVYSISAFQVNREDFLLNVFYNDPELGVDINYIPKGSLSKKPLIQVLNMDRLDPQNNSNPDGVFDFVDISAGGGGTINARNGRIFFPVVEPFGDHLRKQMVQDGIDPTTIDSIVFDPLYDSTRVAAQQVPELNRFNIRGSYKSASGSEISLNALNVPKGSVNVTAGGVVLQENVDYTVDYNLGRVKIINQGLLESQTPIKVSLESNSFFNVQQKTLIGNRFDYRVNKDFNLGATFMKLSERPITQKVNFGDEPINNSIVGFDGSYQTESPFITKMVDALPFIDTKEASNLTVNAEYAQLIPGHSRAIGDEGQSYVDDFEGSQSTIDLRAFNAWTLASVPQGQDDLFPEASLSNDLQYNFNRSHIAWHVIDPLFFRNSAITPPNINADMQSNHLMREVQETEVFPNRELPQGTPNNISVFDLVFDPARRGPYNYNTDLEPDGSLIAPEESWAGIMRRLTTNDFENTNVEFIQFWVMDPFNEDSPNQTGGTLYFNLGTISEDILRDSRKSFENGLPKGDNDDVTRVDTTVWGLVPQKQSIVNAFDNTTNSNKAQDVGLDGLSNAVERTFFADYLNQVQNVVDGSVFDVINNDPSNDDYHYYRGGDYDNLGLDVIERYNRYNGLEGNSPTQQDSPESYPTSATSIPSTEDVNLDNNLSESESYFQYRIELDPAEMEIGKNYITDIVEADPPLRNGQSKPVKWYQFKVPVRDPDRVVGGIQDFRSIRFMRMFLRDFSEPVVLRFARLELVRGEWRKYNLSLFDPNSGSPPPNEDNTAFDVAAVNIEENSERSPVNYVLPPGITREVDAGSTNLRQINEQSLSLKVCELEDGNARAAFRSAGFDARAYKKMKMFVHAEAGNNGVPLEYGDITVFIRLGSDFDNNFYEYEIPVNPTETGGATVGDPNLVWPEANDMEINFEDLKAAKRARNEQGAPFTEAFIYELGDVRIRVKGNPVLNDVQNMMLGIRNPAQSRNKWNQDAGRPVCAEVWLNELRLTDFREEGGWAAVGRVSANLADFGNVAVAGNISTPGFGSIEKRVSERQRETKKGVDASTNLELGKFFPEKSGIKIPMFFGFSEQKSNPQFDPLSPDLELDNTLRTLTREEKKKKLRKSQTYTRRKSINFTNVRKERTGQDKKAHFYDIENFSTTFSYNETYFRDINTERRFSRAHRVGLTYAFKNKPKNIKPFENNEFIGSSQYLQLIRDINFNLGPRQIGFRTAIDRKYSENLIRNNSPFALPPQPTVTKSYNWTRAYDVKYDLSKSVQIDFNANNQAVIEEPAGRVDKQDKSRFEEIRDSVVTSFKRFGETTNYNHQASVTYRLPTKKFPFTEWSDLTLNYTGSYDWTRAPFSQDSLGHTIQNAQKINWNGQFNMTRLYQKIPFLKKVDQKKRKLERQNRRGNRLNLPENKDQADSSRTKSPKRDGLSFGESMASLLMSLKTANLTYSKTQGTLLPGIDSARKSTILGMDPQFASPGFGFVLGKQDPNFPYEAAEKGWLIKQPNLYQPYSRTKSENMSLRFTFEPVKDMRIEVNMSYDRTEDRSSFFRWNPLGGPDSTGAYEDQSPVQNGSYSTSALMLSTLFKADDEVTFDNEVFRNLLANRLGVSQQLGTEEGTSPDSLGFYEGFGPSSQGVIIGAFISAYTGKSPGQVSLNPLKQGMKPNWTVTYDGLGKIPALQKIFRNITLRHGYQSTYSTNYTSNLQALDDNGNRVKGPDGDFIPLKQFNSISLSESFSPLLKLDITLRNSLNTSIEVRKERNISLSLSNLQVMENKSTEYVLGGGYTIRDVKFPFEFNGKELRSDLQLRADISIRKNLTLIRRIAEQFSDPTAGRTVISIKFTMNYVINQNISLRGFFDRTITKPALSIPFPTANTNAGISLRFSLTQ